MADVNTGLRPLDHHFARLMQQLSACPSEALYWAAALTSRASGEGHVCLELAHHAGQPLLLEEASVVLPGLEDWQRELQGCEPVVGGPGDYTPLILEGGRLYLGRFWQLETELARAIWQRLGPQPVELDEHSARLLQGLFTKSAESPNWQQLAAGMALNQAFMVISGGPGTGKTSTVVRILALLLSQPQMATARVVLAAPTGKAAQRLQQAIRSNLAQLAIEDTLRQRIPLEVQTLHRLLGIRADGGMRHNADNPLHAELVVVDEVSMVDLPLMHALLQALPPGSRVILLGDRNQLASVEAGSVLGDLCQHADPQAYGGPLVAAMAQLGLDLPAGNTEPVPMNDAIVQLQHSYRFAVDSGIGRLARAALAGEVGALAGQFQADADLQQASLTQAQLELACTRLVETVYAPWGRLQPVDALQALEQLQLLAVTRHGAFGVVAVNALIEQQLRRRLQLRTSEQWYAGRVIMVQRNDYQLQLFNGDMGIVLPNERGELRAWFLDEAGQPRALLPHRLPAVETAFAITVHKSQGSEYEEVVLLLPEQDSPLLSRELIYTAISRARSRFKLWGELALLQQGVARRVERHSGLIDKLWS